VSRPGISRELLATTAADDARRGTAAIKWDKGLAGAEL
jgi:hypothetical protein